MAGSGGLGLSITRSGTVIVPGNANLTPDVVEIGIGIAGITFAALEAVARQAVRGEGRHGVKGQLRRRFRSSADYADSRVRRSARGECPIRC